MDRNTIIILETTETKRNVVQIFIEEEIQDYAADESFETVEIEIIIYNISNRIKSL